MAKQKEETPESKIAEISKEIVKVEKQAGGIVVTTREEYAEASKFLTAVVKPRVNRIEELVKFFTDPYVEARRVALAKKQEIEEKFAVQLLPLKTIENKIKRAMSDFMLAEEAAARKEEERLRKLRERQDERREEKGLEPVATPLPTVARPIATIASETGKTTAKKSWKFEVQDYSALPDFVVIAVLEAAQKEGITDKVIRKMVVGGIREIKGVRIYEDFDIAASAY